MSSRSDREGRTRTTINKPGDVLEEGNVLVEETETHAEIAAIPPVQQLRLQGLILLEGGKMQPKIPPEQLAKMSDAEQAALAHMLEEQCVCASKDSCRDCEVCVGGVVGHHPWDELEMLKHGWADSHGQHWCGAKAFGDEVEMLHHGMVTTTGQHFTGTQRKHHTSNVANHLGQKGHVKFGKEVQVRETTFTPQAVEDEASGCETPSKMRATPTLTVVNDGTRTAYLMNTAYSVAILDKDTDGKHAILVIGRKPGRAKTIRESVRNVIAIEPKL